MILQPEEWDIKIWKENHDWYIKYIEYVSDTKQNKEFIDRTLAMLDTSLISNILNAIYIKKIKKNNMIGVELYSKEIDFKKIANQLTSEFIFWSDFSTWSIKELFELVLRQSVNLKTETFMEYQKKKNEFNQHHNKN